MSDILKHDVYKLRNEKFALPDRGSLFQITKVNSFTEGTGKWIKNNELGHYDTGAMLNEKIWKRVKRSSKTICNKC